MHVPLTIFVLGLLTGAMLVFRSVWWRLPDRLRRAILMFAAISAVLPALSALTRWSMTIREANAIQHWIGIAGYELILIRFSLIRPQWLTSFCAVVLFAPIFGASLLLPLTDIFQANHNQLWEIDRGYLCERSPWSTSGAEVPGVTVSVYRRPQFAPFLRHLKQQTSFNDEQCDTSLSTASILWNTSEVLFHCPPRPGQKAVDHILPLK